MSPAELQARAEEIAAAAPPLTPEQRARLWVLLKPARAALAARPPIRKTA